MSKRTLSRRQSASRANTEKSGRALIDEVKSAFNAKGEALHQEIFNFLKEIFLREAESLAINESFAVVTTTCMSALCDLHFQTVDDHEKVREALLETFKDILEQAMIIHSMKPAEGTA